MSGEPSRYSFSEEIAHAVSHGLGALLAIAGLAVLLAAAAARRAAHVCRRRRRKRQRAAVVCNVLIG